MTAVRGINDGQLHGFVATAYASQIRCGPQPDWVDVGHPVVMVEVIVGHVCAVTTVMRLSWVQYLHLKFKD